jgi:tetratricopeptide (TPR) repeat protein
LEEQRLALSYEPEAAFVVNEIGVLYDRLRQPKAALAQFEAAADLAPNWSLPHSNLCYAFRIAGDYQKALEHGKQAIRLSPRNVMAFNEIGIVFSKMGNELDAEKTFTRATFLDPTHADSYYNLFCLKARQGNQAVAFEWLEQALQKGFDDMDLLYADTDLADTRLLPQFGWLLEKYGLKK